MMKKLYFRKKKVKKKKQKRERKRRTRQALTDQKKARSDVVEKREISTIMYTCYLNHIVTLE